MTSYFSRKFKESLLNSKATVEFAGSGVTNVFPSTKRLQSMPHPRIPIWLKGFVVSIYHKGRGKVVPWLTLNIQAFSGVPNEPVLPAFDFRLEPRQRLRAE